MIEMIESKTSKKKQLLIKLAGLAVMIGMLAVYYFVKEYPSRPDSVPSVYQHFKTKGEMSAWIEPDRKTRIELRDGTMLVTVAAAIHDGSQDKTIEQIFAFDCKSMGKVGVMVPNDYGGVRYAHARISGPAYLGWDLWHYACNE